jgi:hypothetical protein
LRRLKKIVAVLAIIAVAGLFGGGLVVGHLSRMSARTAIGAPPVDLTAEAVSFQSGSGATVHG